MSSITNGARELKAPSGATDAVLKPSEPVPGGATEVQGIDFDNYADRSITVDELVAGMASMGFQATSVGEAVRIIEGMVGQDFLPSKASDNTPRQFGTSLSGASLGKLFSSPSSLKGIFN